MNLRLARPAIRQLDQILFYIAQRSPAGARHLQSRLQAVMALLTDQPFAGRLTERKSIRRIEALPYSYALTYRIETDEIIVLSIRHTLRRPV